MASLDWNAIGVLIAPVTALDPAAYGSGALLALPLLLAAALLRLRARRGR